MNSLIVCGESTSGCVRASVVDAYSAGFHVTIVEQCVFDRSELSHKVNLFDMHHKYADVMVLEEVLGHLSLRRAELREDAARPTVDELRRRIARRGAVASSVPPAEAVRQEREAGR